MHSPDPGSVPVLVAVYKERSRFLSDIRSFVPIHPDDCSMALANTVLLLVSLLPLAGVALFVRRLVRQRSLRKIAGPPNASMLSGPS